MVSRNEKQRILGQVAVESRAVRPPAVLTRGAQLSTLPLLMTASLPPLNDRPSDGRQSTYSHGSLPPHRPPSKLVVTALGRLHVASGMMIGSFTNLLLRQLDTAGFLMAIVLSWGAAVGTASVLDVLNRRWYAPQNNREPAFAAYRAGAMQTNFPLSFFFCVTCFADPSPIALSLSLPAALLAFRDGRLIRSSLR